MECAGAGDMPEDAERKGLGTPATRAGIIEKLVKTGFVERKQRALLPTQKGHNLIAVLPELVKSPALTAEWEQKLKQVERGELDSADFMAGITQLTAELVGQYGALRGIRRYFFVPAGTGSRGRLPPLWRQGGGDTQGLYL